MPIPRLLAVLTLVGALLACGDDDAGVATGDDPRPTGTGEAGTVAITLAFSEAPSDAQVDESTAILEQRLDGLGVSDARIELEGDHLVVRYPVATNSTDPEAVGDVVGEQGALSFRPVTGVVPPDVAPECGGEPTGGRADTTHAPQLDDSQVVQCYELGSGSVPGTIVREASAVQPAGAPQQWGVALELRDGPNGLDRFNQAAASCFERDQACPTGQVAIVFDGEVMSAPTIQQPTFDSSGVQIRGQFSEDEARDLAIVLRSGALPVGLGVVDIEQPR